MFNNLHSCIYIEQLQCCGINSYNDWYYILGKPQVTPGCCRDDSGVDSDECYTVIVHKPPEEIEKIIYTRGCYQSMIDDLADETLALGIMALV